tara:strand:+ start:149 stop:595 length:447 start_codon:yes stop_codon:yes gene_type:complete
MATLKVKIQEDIILDNQNYGSKRTLEIGNITDIYKRIVTCPASNTTTVVTFADNVYDANSNLDAQNSKYIRITNLDSSNSVEIAVVGAATLYQVRLDAGHSHVLGSADALMLSEADTSPSFGTMADIGKIACNPGANTVDLEFMVAST